MAGSLLQRPGTIGPLRLKNRLIMAPMGTNFGTSDGLSTERDRHYYALRAEGGVAAIVVGDANLPADFLSVLRDASMAGLAIGLPFAAPG